MQWKLPPRIKILEALGAVADGRIKIDGNDALVSSSSGNKKYEVSYDPASSAIMTNDNGSYWQGYLGYPSIAFLLVKGIISFDRKLAGQLAGIKWKDINTKFKNDFTQTEEYIEQLVEQRGGSVEGLRSEVSSIMESLTALKLSKFGKKTLPPQGY